eukprot:6224060-Prorocentrum_lima.AAC.1
MCIRDRLYDEVLGVNSKVSTGLTKDGPEDDATVLKAALREDGGWHVVQKRRAKGHQAAKWCLAARLAAARAAELQRDERAKARQVARVAALKVLQRWFRALWARRSDDGKCSMQLSG